MFFNKKNEQIVEQKKSEVTQVADGFKALFNESEMHKEIICNAIRDLISANQKIDIEVSTIDTLVNTLLELKTEHLLLKDKNVKLLKELMPIMKDEITPVSTNNG